jgi:hypothetical protein
MSERTAVYELFDRQGGRVYVGMSNSPARRFAEHGGTQWWAFVDEGRTAITWYEARAEAADAEMLLIAAYRPPYNITVAGPQPIPAGWETYEPIDWDAELARLVGLTDPLACARQATAAIAEVSTERRMLKQQRRQAVLEMRDRGMSLADIGRELGLHRNRVQQIAEGRSSGGQGGKVEADE